MRQDREDLQDYRLYGNIKEADLYRLEKKDFSRHSRAAFVCLKGFT